MERGRSAASAVFGALVAAALLLAGCRQGGGAHADHLAAAADWPGFGGAAGEQRYSGLDEINARNVGRLNLAWSYDLGPGNSVSAPVEAGGVLYTATGYSVVRAFAATSGKLLWSYDPRPAEVSGVKLRQGWGIRGLAYDAGRVFVGTQDGRLIALDAASGKPAWSVLTTQPGDVRFISGAPRTFGGRVIIGHAGADGGPTRGYVTAYDEATGKQLWRFFTVPGDPAKGFESAAMAAAAKTWSGDWYKRGGGGTAWNAMTYDPELDRIYIGTGNGYPWNQKIRDPAGGDNLYLCSIVALDAKTGKYLWHYQVNPGETWDYNAVMDMVLAHLTIDGKDRRVLMQAPKNGFFYVLDRDTGKLLSAKPFVKVTWATGVDLKTGRPIETPNARYTHGPFEIWPGTQGGHNWLPMSFSPRTGLVYLPASDRPNIMQDAPNLKSWRPSTVNKVDDGVVGDFEPDLPGAGRSWLLGWDPVRQRPRWRVPTPGIWSGGVMSTAGGLVFQGQIDRKFNAYDAQTGKLLWSFAAGSPVLAPPITYRAGGKQYVTVLTGSGVSGAVYGRSQQAFNLRADEPRRVLTFVLDGRAKLPATPSPAPLRPPADPDYWPDAALAAQGSAGYAPDLRAAPVVLDAAAFRAIVKGGALVSAGMPQFGEFSDSDIGALRQYIRQQAQPLRASAGR